MLYTLKFQRNPATAKAPEVAFRGQFLELMGGVEQIRNSETVEISRKERRSSRGVSKSVSRNLDTATRLHVYSSSTSTPVKSTASRKKVSAFGDQFLELMTRFVFLNPLQLLGCSLYKKYQPIHFIKNLIHLNFLEISGNSLLKFLQHIRRVEVIK